MELLVEEFVQHFFSTQISKNTFIVVVATIVILSIYEYIIYGSVSKKNLYNNSYAIGIATIPLFIGTIILTLQSNLVITLGTIGALAIIRFRTAVKDPVDMVYLLWSIHIGITCGCQLYGLAIIVSMIVTMLMFTLNSFSLYRNPIIILIRADICDEVKISNSIKQVLKKYRVKNISFNEECVDFVIETKNINKEQVYNRLLSLNCKKLSIIEYDTEDILQ